MYEVSEGVLISKQEIDEMVQRLGEQITKDYRDKDLVLIGVLKGAFIFMADLCRAIDMPLAVDFIAMQSYGKETQTSGVVRLIKDVDMDIHGKDIIIVEDIIDSGLTLQKLTELMEAREPRSIALCTAFDKPSRRKVNIDVDYVGIEVPDEFIVGYGLDYDELHRNIPEIRFLDESGQTETMTEAGDTE